RTGEATRAVLAHDFDGDSARNLVEHMALNPASGEIIASASRGTFSGSDALAVVDPVCGAISFRCAYPAHDFDTLMFDPVGRLIAEDDFPGGTSVRRTFYPRVTLEPTCDAGSSFEYPNGPIIDGMVFLADGTLLAIATPDVFQNPDAHEFVELDPQNGRVVGRRGLVPAPYLVFDLAGVPDNARSCQLCGRPCRPDLTEDGAVDL